MPRNAAGVYSLPEPPVVADTTILSAGENSTRDDIATELTNSLDRNGRGGMLAPFRISDGLLATPGLAFTNDVDNGFYRTTTDTWHAVVAATVAMTFAVAGLTMAKPLTVNAGTTTTSSPALSVTQTWNDAAVTFVGKHTNITSTASAAASLVERWQVGGANVMELRKDGLLTVAGSVKVLYTLDVGSLGGNLTVAGGSGENYLYTAGSGQRCLEARNQHASNPVGIQIAYSAAAPNDVGHVFVGCVDSAANRAYITANGGFHNYQANDSNLSDMRVKDAYQGLREEGLLPALWDAHKNIQWGRYKYKDQTHDDFNYGYNAQNIAEVFAIAAPALVDEWMDEKNPGLLSVYSEDLRNITGAIVTELQRRVEELERRL